MDLMVHYGSYSANSHVCIPGIKSKGETGNLGPTHWLELSDMAMPSCKRDRITLGEANISLSHQEIFFFIPSNILRTQLEKDIMGLRPF